MKWTNDVPIKEGWYWIKFRWGVPECVCVRKFDQELYVWMCNQFCAHYVSLKDNMGAPDFQWSSEPIQLPNKD